MHKFYLTNTWNRVRYTAYLPVYNAVLHTFGPQRAMSIGALPLQPGQRVLVVGAGTGLDLEYFPEHTHLTAIDLTPGMIRRLKKRAKAIGRPVDAHVMDAQALRFADNSFDHVVLHLILAVVPNAEQTLAEAKRVLRPGGYVAVFDKFLPDGAQPSTARRVVNEFSRFLATDLNRRLADLLLAVPLQRISDVPVRFGGLFRVILLHKAQDATQQSASPRP